MNFWEKLTKPIFILAPMEDVTDTVFRQIVADCARPDVFFTEFTNVDGFFSKGKEKVMQRLIYHRSEKPIVAQIWGLKPDNFYNAARLLGEMKFDGIDINLGCPQKKVTKKGACAALIDNRKLAKEIIEATLAGAGKLPVSVKTRLGFKSIQTEDWISFLLAFPLAALTIHGRIAAEMSEKPADWEEIGKAVKIRNSFFDSRNLTKKTGFRESKPLIIGNGDVLSHQEAMAKADKYGVDGVMIGRGIFENLWIFAKQPPTNIKLKDKLQLLKKHLELFNKTWEKTKDFNIMKKYYKIYIRDFPEAATLRTRLMQFRNHEETIKFLDELISKFPD